MVWKEIRLFSCVYMIKHWKIIIKDLKYLLVDKIEKRK